MRMAYLMTVRPILTYGAVVWYKGDKQKGLIKKLELIQNRGLRKIAGVFKTTTVAALENILSIPPIEVYIKYLRRKYAI